MQTLLQVGRLAQFIAAAVMVGLPAFRLYAVEPGAGRTGAGADDRGWRAMMAGAGLLGVLGVLLWAMMQAASMSDLPGDAVSPAALWDVLSQMHVGRIALLRAGLMLLVLLVSLAPARSGVRLAVQTLIGAVIIASFAWSGHGGIPGGWLGRLHRAADVLHGLAAGLWIGGLAGFCRLVVPSAEHLPARQSVPAGSEILDRALVRFSGIGSAIVATIVLTGLVNAWLLVGPAHWPDLFRTGYGVGLLVKLALFGGMVCFAALNRFVLTPSLALSMPRHSNFAASRSLRRSIAAETVLSVLVLAAVSVIGTLPPPGLGR